MPAASSAAGSTVAPFSKRSSRVATLTIATTREKYLLLNPRLARRRTRGICPPSKAKRRENPGCAECPLSPRPAVLPWPDPGPRPTRLRFFRFTIPRWTSLISILDRHPAQPRDLLFGSQFAQRIERRADKIHGIGRPAALGEHVLHSGRFENGPHGVAGDH